MRLLLCVAGLCGWVARASEPELVVGVTNQAYYSWTMRLVEGLPVEVIPLVPAGEDLHHFEPGTEDVLAVQRVGLLVANGIGHDPFVERMLQAAGRSDVPRVDLHQGVPLIPYQRPTAHEHGAEESPETPALAANPHTWLSLSAAIPQIYNLERDLSQRLPAHAEVLRQNARQFVRTLRRMKADAARRLRDATPKRLATVHDGYAYLLQEFGLSVRLVLQPRHGVEPSAREIAAQVEALRAAGIQVLLAEADAPRRYVELLAEETGLPVYSFHHLGTGPYRADAFEVGMQENLEVLIRALAPAAPKAPPADGGRDG